MRHPIRGILIGPLVAPLAFWIGVTLLAWLSGSRMNWDQAVRELVIIAAFGTPIAYIAALAWGAPALYVLHRLGWLRAWTVILTGTLGGAIVAVACQLLQQGALFQVHMPIAAGAGIGALAGGTCWRAGR